MLKCFLLDFLKDFELNYLSFLDLQRSGTLENVVLKSFSGFVNQMFPEKRTLPHTREARLQTSAFEVLLQEAMRAQLKQK